MHSASHMTSSFLLFYCFTTPSPSTFPLSVSAFKCNISNPSPLHRSHPLLFIWRNLTLCKHLLIPLHSLLLYCTDLMSTTSPTFPHKAPTPFSDHYHSSVGDQREPKVNCPLPHLSMGSSLVPSPRVKTVIKARNKHISHLSPLSTPQWTLSLIFPRPHCVFVLEAGELRTTGVGEWSFVREEAGTPAQSVPKSAACITTSVSYPSKRFKLFTTSHVMAFWSIPIPWNSPLLPASLFVWNVSNTSIFYSSLHRLNLFNSLTLQFVLS